VGQKTWFVVIEGFLPGLFHLSLGSSCTSSTSALTLSSETLESPRDRAVKAVILPGHPLSKHDGSSSFLNEVACEVGVTDFDKVVACAVFVVPLSA
jgi:hypothetical protein